MSNSSDLVNVLAVVPARGGSVGIPRKNLARVAGETLIARVGDTLRQLPWITKAIISTDDAEMRQEGLRVGLEAPFRRPTSLSGGLVSGSEVLLHAWSASEMYYRQRFDFALYLEPTSPLRLPSDVEMSLRTLLESDCDSVVTVSPMPAHYAPEKCLLVDHDGHLRSYLGRETVQARQQIPPYYFRNGAAYAVKREVFFKTKRILGGSTRAVIIDRPLVNIDDPLDLILADCLASR